MATPIGFIRLPGMGRFYIMLIWGTIRSIPLLIPGIILEE
jgi:hypothetical protein